MLKYVIQYKFSILLAGFIVLLSLLPGNTMPHSSLFSIPYFDKFVHFGMYGSLGVVALLEFRCRQICLKKELLLLLLIFCLSTLMEVLQSAVVATRLAEWLDLVANFFGLIAAYAAYAFFRVFRS
ncbi:MAG: VanZ family protein [Bacteroidales bacterium]